MTAFIVIPMPLIIIGMLASSLSILLEVVGCPKDRFAEEIFFFMQNCCVKTNHTHSLVEQFINCCLCHYTPYVTASKAIYTHGIVVSHYSTSSDNWSLPVDTAMS